MGECAALTASVITAHIPFTGKFYDPRAINPYRKVGPESEKMKRVRARIAQLQLHILADELRAK